MEYLLQKENKRYTVFPTIHKDLWEFYKLHEELYWTPDELDLSGDLANWNNLSENEQYFIKHILAFFAASDGIVAENLMTRFCQEVQITEAQMFYGFQLMIENMHGETYSRLIEALVRDPTEKDNLFNAMHEIPSIKKKAEWALKWISSDQSFATRVVAFAIVEGIFFSGAFCAIDWLKERKLGLTGLCDSNSFISRDESLHCLFAVCLYVNYVQNKLSEEEIYQIVDEAVRIEEEFIIESLPCTLLGMKSDSMRQYIKFVANRLIVQLNYNKLYKDAKQPFPFMETRNLEDITNFFDKRSNNYKRKVIRDYSEIDTVEHSVCFDEEFNF